MVTRRQFIKAGELGGLLMDAVRAINGPFKAGSLALPDEDFDASDKTIAQVLQGHVINISSIGVLSNAPRFSAYVASKAAMDAFARCAGSEFADDGIAFTTINMPLVRTSMTAPTKGYESVPMLTPDEAADLIVRAIIGKPERVATGLGIFAEVLYAVAPKVSHVIMNTAYRMFPESDAALGNKEDRAQHASSADQTAFAELMRGFHL